MLSNQCLIQGYQTSDGNVFMHRDEADGHQRLINRL